jgi:glycosyltransferase involved in cell wall biosynthesis
MLNNKKIVVVMPAYHAAKTLQTTYDALPHDIVDHVVLVDDCSSDETAELSKQLDIHTIQHKSNKGYGGNQKTCYAEALKLGADVIVMVHPDYQYEPRLVTAMASLISSGVYDCAIGSRILGKTALKGGMPWYKYVANRCLTLFQNILLNAKLSEYHTGYRAFSREVLESIPLEKNMDDFAFDNEMLAQIIGFDYSIGEVSCPTKYFADASSINLIRSVQYGLHVIRISIRYRLHKLWLFEYDLLKK